MHVPAMADLYHQHDPGITVSGMDDPIIALSDAWRRGQAAVSRAARVFRPRVVPATGPGIALGRTRRVSRR